MPISLSVLERRLGYQFQQQDLFRQALTHRSYSAKNNERLEFLGDSIVNFIIADALYRQFPSAQEGQLSRLRANLVRRQALAEVAREMSLGEHLIMGAGELKSGGFNRDSILSDALEAIIGAMFFESDFPTTQSTVMSWFRPKLDELSLENLQKDAKTRLQELLQSKAGALPYYTVTSTEGMSHDQVFTVECRCEFLKLTTIGQGGSRRIAEQVAAANALDALALSDEGDLQ